MENKNINQTNELEVSNESSKDYKEERFEFALYINDNLICKRNFRMYNFIENSMQSEDFKDFVNYVVTMIDDDLKSKSRIYTWYHFNPNERSEEYTRELPQPWEHTFKFTISDNTRKDSEGDKREVHSQIWDGSSYPAIVRNNVDIANNTIRFTKKDGTLLVFDAEKFCEDNKNNMTPEVSMKKAMIWDKPNLLPIITKKICETCSPWNNSPYEKISDYTTKLTFGKGKNVKTYDMLIDRANKKMLAACDKAMTDKTNAYFNRK